MLVAVLVRQWLRLASVFYFSIISIVRVKTVMKRLTIHIRSVWRTRVQLNLIVGQCLWLLFFLVWPLHQRLCLSGLSRYQIGLFVRCKSTCLPLCQTSNLEQDEWSWHWNKLEEKPQGIVIHLLPFVYLGLNFNGRCVCVVARDTFQVRAQSWLDLGRLHTCSRFGKIKRKKKDEKHTSNQFFAFDSKKDWYFFRTQRVHFI